MHSPTVQSMKSAAVLTRTGNFLSFFVPAAGNLAAQVFPAPGICHPLQKNRSLMPEGGGHHGCTWNRLKHYTYSYVSQNDGWLITVYVIISLSPISRILVGQLIRIYIGQIKSLSSVKIPQFVYYFPDCPLGSDLRGRQNPVFQTTGACFLVQIINSKKQFCLGYPVRKFN